VQAPLCFTFNLYHILDSNKQATHVENTKCLVLSSADLQGRPPLECLWHSRSAAIIHNLSKFKKQSVGVGMGLAASRTWSRRGSRIVVLPRRQLKPDQYVKHDGNRKATDRTSSIETAAHDL
jgi:hypothetical protein